MTYVVALTGGIGSGKTTVADRFSERGVPVIDADVIAREVVAPGSTALQQIETHFGAQALLPDGSLDRSWLRQQIFAEPPQKVWLNNLLHPLIQQRTQDMIKAVTADWCLWVVPLLVENNLHLKADRVLVIDVDEETQINRTMARDQISRQQAEAILIAQASRQSRLAVADDIIDNTGTPAEQEQDINTLFRLYQRLASVKKGSVS